MEERYCDNVMPAPKMLMNYKKYVRGLFEMTIREKADKILTLQKNIVGIKCSTDYMTSEDRQQVRAYEIEILGLAEMLATDVLGEKQGKDYEQLQLDVLANVYDSDLCAELIELIDKVKGWEQ